MNDDPTEAERRRLLPIVNQPAVDALNASGRKVLDEVRGPDGTLPRPLPADLDRRRDAEAVRMLRDDLVKAHGEDNVFDTEQLAEQFEVTGFAAPFAVVVRKSDGEKGSLEFTHYPRFYFNFRAD